MRVTKPSWVIHKDTAAKNDQTSKRLSIFSIHVHPDGSRIATGGLDAKIRIWSTKPILNAASENSGKPPKSLCTLTMHTGPVLTVRWAHSGRWLASGSDDEIVMVWDLDPTSKGKVWGSDEINVEGWKPLKRLPGHESDVTDVAWSPGDRYLASVGLDSMVIIWCGFTLERLRKIDQHQGFVKGVCWDPVGEFLATQSDDRSVKIWRTTDWSLEAEVRKPFEDSPGSTFFRRLSWSPDGAHITASNATNNKGFVFIAAVIARNTWTSEISLVGHENTVEVASYNPHIFLRNPASPVATSNICSVVALGADDRSVSIWQTKSARPLIVTREVFERQIMDLSWSWDGMTLYAASSDGTIAVFDFDAHELDGIAPHSMQQQYLQKFGFVPPPIPEGYSHSLPSHAPDPSSSSRITPPPSPNRTTPGQAEASSSQAQNGFGHSVDGSGERINMLVAKRKGPKRIQPTLASSIPSASTKPVSVVASNAPTSSSALRSFGGDTKPSSMSVNQIHSTPLPQPEPALQLPTADLRSFTSNNTFPGADDMDMDVPISSFDRNGAVTSNIKGKRKASMLDAIDDTRTSKPRTLGGDVTKGHTVVREIEAGRGAIASASHLWDQPHIDALPRPPLLTFLSSRTEGSDDVLEARNPESEGQPEVLLTGPKGVQFLDYLPSPVLRSLLTSCFCAVAMIDGSVNVYSHTGRRLMPTMSLGSPCTIIDGCQNSLMIVTCSGLLYSWNVKTQSAVFPPISVLPLLSPSPNCVILSANVRPNGVPVIQCSTGVAHSYDPALSTWVKVSERFWSEGSDFWQGRQRGNAQSAARGVLVSIESTIGTNDDGSAAEKPRPAWWSAALTLGHLETRMHAAKVLDSASEYKQALLLYAKKISDEAFKGKAEELIKELYGPVYWRPGREDSWSPMVLGMSKRDLLKDVLSLFVRSKNLAKMGMEWQEIVKRASNDEL